MLLIAIMIVCGLGMMLRRRKVLQEETAERIGLSVKTISASVDGKPVCSYIMDKPQ